MTFKVKLNGEKIISGRTYADVVRELMRLELRKLPPMIWEPQMKEYRARAGKRFSALRPGFTIPTQSNGRFVRALVNAGLMERME